MRECGEKVERRWREGGEKVERKLREGGERRWREYKTGQIKVRKSWDIKKPFLLKNCPR